jgi:1,4-dihydroxy-2-naphthoate octaprenyltransferase
MFSRWILAIRPKTLPAGICPVVMGSVLAYRAGYFDFWAGFLSLMAAVLVQIGTNLANDYYDFKKGADTEDRLGPIRVTQSGLISQNVVKWAFICVFCLAGLCAVFLMVRAGWPVIVIGALSLLCGYMYTGGPFPFAYVGLGDLVAFIFFGPVAVAGTYFVHTLYWSSDAIFLGMAPGFFFDGYFGGE